MQFINSNKNNYLYGSIWDELPDSSTIKKSKSAPRNISEAQELYAAAQSSVDKATFTTWDNHNDMLKKSAELRKIYDRKKFIEEREQKHRDEQREIMREIALDNEKQKILLENVHLYF